MGGRKDEERETGSEKDLYSIPAASSLDRMQQRIDNTVPKWKEQPELNAYTEQRGGRSEWVEEGLEEGGRDIQLTVWKKKLKQQRKKVEDQVTQRSAWQSAGEQLVAVETFGKVVMKLCQKFH